jgi:hypothetical protein
VAVGEKIYNFWKLQKLLHTSLYKYEAEKSDPYDVHSNFFTFLMINSIQFIFISPQTSQYIGQHNEKNYQK